MNDYNRKPPNQKRLQAQLDDPAIKTAGSSVPGIQSISSLQAAFMNMALPMQIFLIDIESMTSLGEELREWGFSHMLMNSHMQLHLKKLLL